jgi:uncharacterized protein YjdB
MGIYSDGGERNISGAPNVTWTSSDTTVATISPAGQATGVKPGTTTISVALGAISQNVTLTVTNATLTKLAVAPSSRIVEPFTKLPFTAMGVLSDHSVQDFRAYVTWASSSPSVATISNVPQIGLATAVAGGSTNISAMFGGQTATVPLQVASSTLTGLTLTPTATAMAIGSVAVLRATAQYSDGASVPVGQDVTWSSSDSTVASINAQGTITGVAAGTATITATTPNNVSASSTITVEPLQSVAITPATLTEAAGTYMRFTATGTLSDGTTQDLTPSVTWTSSTPAVAVISNVAGTFGAAIGLTPGMSTIGAVLDGQVGSAQVTVTGATLQSITLAPLNPSVAVTSFQAFKAVGNFNDSTTQVLTPQVTWTSSDVTVAVVDAFGNALPAGTGTTTITAKMGSVTASTTLTITP